MITVREWIKKYNKGDFSSSDYNTQFFSAGWWNWCCPERVLSTKLQKMAEVVKLITNDYVLDNYYIVFNNSEIGRSVDSFNLNPMDIEQPSKRFIVVGFENDLFSKKSVYRGLSISYPNSKPEFQSSSETEIATFINELGITFSNDPHPVVKDDTAEKDMEFVEELFN